MSTSIIKQVCINKINISDDLQTIIKSYCFYDRKSWDIIQSTKFLKNKLNLLLKNESVSRKNTKVEHLIHEWNEDDEHWIFWVFNDDNGPNPQLQAINCFLCGDYLMATSHIPEKITCKCNRDMLETIDLDDVSEIGSYEWF